MFGRKNKPEVAKDTPIAELPLRLNVYRPGSPWSYDDDVWAIVQIHYKGEWVNWYSFAKERKWREIPLVTFTEGRDEQSARVNGCRAMKAIREYMKNPKTHPPVKQQYVTEEECR